MTDQLTGDNLLDPVKVDYTEIQKFTRENVCSICRHHPEAMSTDDRNVYEIHCLVCGMPIIAGGYISIYELDKLEMNEWDTKNMLRKSEPNKKFDEAQALKELGF